MVTCVCVLPMSSIGKPVYVSEGNVVYTNECSRAGETHQGTKERVTSTLSTVLG